MKKYFKRIFLFIVLIGAVSLFVIYNVLPYALIQPHKANTTNFLEIEKQKYSKLSLVTKDSILLKGYRVKSNIDTIYGAIILVHGIGGCKEHFTKAAIDLANKGYESWIFDNRAHGESGGKYSTYGFHEKHDISRIVDEIKNRLPNHKIGIWGNSLGGAIAIQAVEIDKRIDFGIIESTFTELDKIVYDYQKRYAFNIGVKWACNIALKKASEIAKFKPDDVKPINSVKNIQQPMLIAHGDADENIKYEYGQQLFNNLAANDKIFVPVKGAGHYSMYQFGGEIYSDKLFHFLERQTKQ